MKAAIAALAALFLAGAAGAAPTFHPLFSDHGMLQRDRPIRLWGKADPAERLSVTFGPEHTAVVAGADGIWRAELPAMAAGGPYRLEVIGAGGARAAGDDMLVGDVWLCSGQSNMELPLTRVLNNDSEIAGARDPELRILTVPKKTAVSPAYGFGGPAAWAAVTPQSVPGFSAACYFMAKELRASQRVPIGAINASWGGTAIRSWLDESASRAVGGADVDLLALYRRDPGRQGRPSRVERCPAARLRAVRRDAGELPLRRGERRGEHRPPRRRRGPSNPRPVRLGRCAGRQPL